ncbi:hypothetical protein CATRI_10155 [Corynebacterium atrinae]|uniref:hypothetical protein n=1 Tax=Corynebacterium atrinae TaxID=1336740 RepID=UPI0025B2A12B|nr:hypothetical protein [Corynebacterium atrinae]WJY64094.1 hypothetical protein CATRI_10155 [Corynebacterium atrinae]
MESCLLNYAVRDDSHDDASFESIVNVNKRMLVAYFFAVATGYQVCGMCLPK